MKPASLAVGITVFLLIGVAADVAHAQRNRPQPPKKENKQGTGRLEGMQNGIYQVDLDGQKWLVRLSPDARVHVRGEAEVGFVQPGRLVRFAAEFDRKRKTTTPVTEIEVGQLELGEKTGVFPDEAPGFSVDLPKRGAPSLTSRMRVLAPVASLKEGVIQVGKYKAELAPDAKVTVDLADLQVASVGDKIFVKGWYIMSGALVAEEAEVTLSKPLSAPKKPVRPKGKNARGKSDVDKAEIEKTDAEKPAEKPAEKTEFEQSK